MLQCYRGAHERRRMEKNEENAEKANNFNLKPTPTTTHMSKCVRLCLTTHYTQTTIPADTVRKKKLRLCERIGVSKSYTENIR